MTAQQKKETKAKEESQETKSAEAKETQDAQTEQNQTEETEKQEAAELITGQETEDGTIRISENVIAAVVRRYVLEVEGVARFASGSLVGGLAEMIGRRNQEGSVIVRLEGDAVNISVTLILEFGVKVPEVAGLVQDVIRSRVEELTGKHVTSVDVIVQDLEEPEPEEEEQTEAQKQSQSQS